MKRPVWIAMAVLGIDLGKSNCAVAVKASDGSKVLVDTVEPVVALSFKDGWIVGKEARDAARAGRADAVWDLLELLGRCMSDLTVAQTTEWPFRLVQGPAGKVTIEYPSKSPLQRTVFSPEEIVAVLLAHMRRLAEHKANEPVGEAVVTVPVCFNHTQRRALRDACTMAGIKVKRFILGATAAAIAHIKETTNAEDDGGLFLVIDMGAGSINLSLVSLRAENHVEVKAVAGDSTLGGVSLTERVLDHFLQDSRLRKVASNTKELQRLRRASQLAKKMLSTSESATVQLELSCGPFEATITRGEFDVACSTCWEQLRAMVNRVLRDGHSRIDDVHSILLCGGSVVVPALEDLVKRMFSHAKVTVNVKDPLQAKGAAILAGPTATIPQTVKVDDVTPLAFGVQRLGAKDATVLIPANARLPTSGDNLFFAGCQTADLVYRVMESHTLGQQKSRAKSDGMVDAHCVGTVRVPRAVMPSISAAQLVTKLTIAIDVDLDLQLTVSTTEMASKEQKTTVLVGDDTVLPRESVERMRMELAGTFGENLDENGAHTVENGDHPSTNPDAFMKHHESDLPAVKAVKEYALPVRTMASANKIEIELSDTDKHRLTAKVDHILEWLHSTARNSQLTATVGTGEGSANSDSHAHQFHKDMLSQLQALRRLECSIASANAIAQLQDADP